MVTKTDSNNEPTGAPALPTKRAKNLDQDNAAPVTDVPANDIVIKPAKLDTPETDAAIDDIVAKEADEVLAAQDAGIAAAEAEASNQPAEPERHGHPVFWFIIVLFVIVIAVTVYVLMNPGLELPFSA